MPLILLVSLPFLAAFALSGCRGQARWVQTLVAAAAIVAGLAIVIGEAPAVLGGSPAVAQVAWAGAVGLNLSLMLDPLALFFAGLILIIGLLVVVYAHGYMGKDERTGRFLAFLMLFQGAMLGIVVSANILVMLVFWEMTSLSSFLLIGFWRERAEAREGARMALAVTGGGGLALIAGMLLLGQAAGSFELTTILQRGDIVRASPLYLPMLALILMGCFTKSAQFPFHFWLPHAMAAPTPVSAYLHSATMVKAGVFLIARLWPVLAGTDAFFYAVATTGLVTMTFGAGVALFRDDLKAILAYSTISQLGLMVMLLGFATPVAAVAAVFHILNHAAFKAALFMNAGTIDHETGTRDINRLGGLARLMPLSAVMGTLAAASMAGLPPLNGFISKEMMLEQALHTTWAGQTWLVPLLTVIAATLSVAYSLRYAVLLYFGRRRDETLPLPHEPGLAMTVPPMLLVALVVLIGLLPMTIAGQLVVSVAAAVIGGPSPKTHLALWHGINPALGASLLAVGVGAVLLWRYAPLRTVHARLPLPDGKRVFEASLDRVIAFARRAILAIHRPSLQRTLFVTFATVLLLGIEAMVRAPIGEATRATLPASPVAVIAWLLLVSSTAAVVLSERNRFIALILISVVGLVIALAFVHFSAPDLALTQITVEVVTILLLLLALNLLPKHPRLLSSGPKRMRDAMLALTGGGLAGAAAWAFLRRDPPDPISAFHWANSYSGGGGTNVVNVTLVDFRAFDTLGEIVVLGIAGLVIYALLETAARGQAGRRLRAWQEDMPHSPERHPVMFVMATRLLLPLTLLAAIYIFLRGHNQPGGGFIAALVVSIAIILQYLASGYDWTVARRRLSEHQLIGWGVLIALATGAGAFVFGHPFLTSAFDYLHLPLIGEFELASAMLFDLGVLSVVVGAVTLTLAQLSHVAQRAARSYEAGPDKEGVKSVASGGAESPEGAA